MTTEISVMYGSEKVNYYVIFDNILASWDLFHEITDNDNNHDSNRHKTLTGC